MNERTPPLIGGRYELGELLGRGGMAEVRKGTDTRLGRTVAIKRLRTDLASDATFQARFRREAKSSASLGRASAASRGRLSQVNPYGAGISDSSGVRSRVLANAATKKAIALPLAGTF